jgi:UDP-N-acetylglucosamine--N-acetylmuramyl-(pentapeptide) pyrophosphoryl-undecaprenol N-acetylglucosamine transferase
VAAWRGTPILIQEQNSFPGITNRLLAKVADKICVAYPGMDRFFPEEKIILTGNPIRKEVIRIEGKRESAATTFGLDSHKTTVLVIGGSQGALSINKAIEKSLMLFKENGLQLLWQTGPSYIIDAVNATSRIDYGGIRVVDFIREMDLAYAMSDIIISRAGAIASAEIAAVGKPVIFIPLPTAAEDHQMKNARAFEEKGAAIVVQDKESASILPELLPALLKEPERLNALAINIKKLSAADATDRICDAALKLIDP